MREILFKAKRLDNGEWVEGYYVFDKDDYVGIIVSYIDYQAVTTFAVGGVRILSETVCQYTGKTDRNGDKIFEGDIVNIIADDEQGIIEWDKDEAHFTVNVDNCCSTFTNHYGTDLEIIGNIHDKE